MADTLQGWTDLLRSYSPMIDADIALRITTPLEQSTAGGSGAFLALASDGKKYWVKPLNNFQSPRVCYTELVVSALGRLIGAPVCEVQPIKITSDVAGWVFRSDRALEVGTASASLEVAGALEDRMLRDRARDDNANRQAGVVALNGWLGGNDSQWLYVKSEDERIYSHDHGHFLPGQNEWNGGHLISALLTAPQLPASLEGHAGLDQSQLVHLTNRLKGLSEPEIAQAVSAFPASWNVSLEDRAALAYYADVRRIITATEIDQVRLAISV